MLLAIDVRNTHTVVGLVSGSGDVMVKPIGEALGITDIIASRMVVHEGRYTGEITSTNIIAASIEAYVDALNELLAEAHWQDAPEAAGNRKRAKVSAPAAREQRAELDEDAAEINTTDWFNQ